MRAVYHGSCNCQILFFHFVENDKCDWFAGYGEFVGWRGLDSESSQKDSNLQLVKGGSDGLIREVVGPMVKRRWDVKLWGRRVRVGCLGWGYFWGGVRYRPELR